MEKLRQNPRGYVTATVRETAVGGTGPEVVYEKVGIHLKGAAGSFRGVDDRPGLTVRMDRFSPDQVFHGLHKFHLNNSVQDASYMSENLGNAIFREAGVPATRVTYARVWLNDRDMGVMVFKESFDVLFLKRFFDDHHGTLYEGAYKDIDSGLPGTVHKARQDPARLKSLVEAAQERDPDARRRKVGEVLDADRFSTFMAVESLTAHWDGYTPNVNNYRVYDNPATTRFEFIPHGTDQLFQNSGFPLVQDRGLIARAVSEAPDDRLKYLDRVAELRRTVFTPDRLTTMVDRISDRLMPLMKEIGEDAVRRHKEQTDGLKQRVLERVKGVDQLLASTPRPLKFDAAGVVNLADRRWAPQVGGGRATLEQAEQGGRPLLHIRNDGGGDSTASYRTTVLLTKGHYVFEGPCRTAKVGAPPGENSGAGLRISGGKRRDGLTGDTDWKPEAFAFEVTEPSREVVLVCELKAGAGEAWFDLSSLKLRRK